MSLNSVLPPSLLPPLTPALLVRDQNLARNIFKHLDATDCLRCALVCKQYRDQTITLRQDWKAEFCGGEDDGDLGGFSMD